MTRGRRQVNISTHCCPNPTCAYRSGVGWGNLRTFIRKGQVYGPTERMVKEAQGMERSILYDVTALGGLLQ
jgi:hypothetical protein